MSIPWYDPESVAGYFCFCEALVTEIPMFELGFTPDYMVSNVFKEFIDSL